MVWYIVLLNSGKDMLGQAGTNLSLSSHTHAHSISLSQSHSDKLVRRRKVYKCEHGRRRYSAYPSHFITLHHFLSITYVYNINIYLYIDHLVKNVEHVRRSVNMVRKGLFAKIVEGLKFVTIVKLDRCVKTAVEVCCVCICMNLGICVHVFIYVCTFLCINFYVYLFIVYVRMC